MKKIISVFGVVWLLAFGLAVTAAAETERPDDCVEWVDTTYEEVIDEEEHWQRYSWTPRGNVLDQDAEPDVVPPHENWQPNVKGDPHEIGEEGPYAVSNENSGRSDWFYLELVPATYKEVIDVPGYCLDEPVDEPEPEAKSDQESRDSEPEPADQPERIDEPEQPVEVVEQDTEVTSAQVSQQELPRTGLGLAGLGLLGSLLVSSGIYLVTRRATSA